MNLFNYLSIYLLIGVVIMVVLDVMHHMVKHLVDDEFKEGYKNWERLYIILVWPTFMYSLVKTIVNNNK